MAVFWFPIISINSNYFEVELVYDSMATEVTLLFENHIEWSIITEYKINTKN